MPGLILKVTRLAVARDRRLARPRGRASGILSSSGCPSEQAALRGLGHHVGELVVGGAGVDVIDVAGGEHLQRAALLGVRRVAPCGANFAAPRSCTAALLLPPQAASATRRAGRAARTGIRQSELRSHARSFLSWERPHSGRIDQVSFQVFFARGLRASCIASPIRLNASTVKQQRQAREHHVPPGGRRRWAWRRRSSGPSSTSAAGRRRRGTTGPPRRGSPGGPGSRRRR